MINVFGRSRRRFQLNIVRGVGVLVMVGISSGVQAQTSGVAPDAENAASQYWLAFSECRSHAQCVDLATGDDEKFGFAVPVGEELASYFQGHGEQALIYLHRGAALSRCEWGTDLRKGPVRGFAGSQIYGEKAHYLARVALLRARWRFEHGDWDGGIDDVMATLALGRHLGRDKICVSVHFGCMLTGMSTFTPAVYLRQMPAQARRRLARQLKALPPATPMREVVLNHKKLIDWAIEKFQNAKDQEQLFALLVSISDQPYAEKIFQLADTAARLVKLAEAARPLADQIADATSLRPDAYDKLYQEQFAPQLAANPLAEPLGSWYLEARDEESTGDCRIALLLAAIDIVDRGEIALKDHPDPYGDGLFRYSPFDDGFQLGSKLVYGDLGVEMDFGLRKKMATQH